MKNPHIIVGEPRRCLCGVYDGQSIGCNDLIQILSRIEDGDSIDVFTQKDLSLLTKVIRSHIRECD